LRNLPCRWNVRRLRWATSSRGQGMKRPFGSTSGGTTRSRSISPSLPPLHRLRDVRRGVDRRSRTKKGRAFGGGPSSEGTGTADATSQFNVEGWRIASPSGDAGDASSDGGQHGSCSFRADRVAAGVTRRAQPRRFDRRRCRCAEMASGGHAKTNASVYGSDQMAIQLITRSRPVDPSARRLQLCGARWNAARSIDQSLCSLSRRNR
jgi:hypothetical protein